MPAPDARASGAAAGRDAARGTRLLVGSALAAALHAAVLLGVRLEPASPRPGGAGTTVEVALVAAAPSPGHSGGAEPAAAVAPPPPPATAPPPERRVPRPEPPEAPAPRPEPLVARPESSSLPATEEVAPAEGDLASRSPDLPAGVPGAGTQTDGGPPAPGAIQARPRYRINPKPVYPLAARRRRQEGVVVLSVSVSAAGEPVAVEIQTSSGVRVLDDAAVDAVRRWRFEPGTVAGEAVPSRVEVPIRFELD